MHAVDLKLSIDFCIYLCAGYGLQVNYLGPYHLTRLLEGQLASSAPSRVVSVSSIMHRSGHVDSDPESFLKDWNKGSQYSNTKLGNVLFAYEAQRRLGPKGIQVRPHRNLKAHLCASSDWLARCREVQIKAHYLLVAFTCWALLLNRK